MIHTSVLDKMGEFESFTLAEDVNYSFKLRKIGEKMVFEPRSVITYVAGPPFKPYDLPFYKFRWNPVQGKASVEKLKASWPLFDKYCDEKLSWAEFHRSRVSPFFYLTRRVHKIRSEFLDLKTRAIRKLKKILKVGQKENVYS